MEERAIMQLAKGCASYIIIPFVLALIAVVLGFLLEMAPLFIVSAFLFFCFFGMMIFFRDPELEIGEGIVSPANGKVTGIDRSEDTNIVKVKVFMNVWNIHVNRCPMDGKVISVEHIAGGHIPAFDKNAETNERVITDLETHIGKVRIVQIAGSVARRIVPYIKQGDRLGRGDRIGIIRLGSRVDLHLPGDRVDIQVKLGEIVRPGQTVARILLSGENEKDEDGEKGEAVGEKGEEVEKGEAIGEVEEAVGEVEEVEKGEAIGEVGEEGEKVEVVEKGAPGVGRGRRGKESRRRVNNGGSGSKVGEGEEGEKLEKEVEREP